MPQLTRLAIKIATYELCPNEFSIFRSRLHCCPARRFRHPFSTRLPPARALRAKTDRPCTFLEHNFSFAIAQLGMRTTVVRLAMPAIDVSEPQGCRCTFEEEKEETETKIRQLQAFSGICINTIICSRYYRTSFMYLLRYWKKSKYRIRGRVHVNILIMVATNVHKFALCDRDRPFRADLSQ